MTDILKPVPLTELLDANHLEAVSQATGEDASTFLLSEPNMRDFGMITAPLPVGATDEVISKREALGVAACFKNMKGDRPMTAAHFLEMPSTTGNKLSSLCAAWVEAIKLEAEKGLGKAMVKSGLKEALPSSKPSTTMDESLS